MRTQGKNTVKSFKRGKRDLQIRDWLKFWIGWFHEWREFSWPAWKRAEERQKAIPDYFQLEIDFTRRAHCYC